MHDWMINEIKGNIGLNLIEMIKFEEAIQYYTQQINSDPNNAELYFWRGRTYREVALTSKRENNHQNTEKSMEYFQNSNDDYQKALELHNKQD